MVSMTALQRHLDRLYAELAALRRHVLLNLPAEKGQSSKAWEDLVAASKDISAQWTGPDAVAEIRAQREK